MPAERLEKDSVSVPPLRKKGLKAGKVYTRFPEIEQKLDELLALPSAEVVPLCEVLDDKCPNYVPSECLVYLVRACRGEAANPHFERLYKALLERMVRRLPSGESKDGKKIALQDSLIQEGVLDRFREWLAIDLNAYEERLDFYEVRFDMALKRLKRTIQKEVWSAMNQSSPLEDPETGEIATHVEEAAGMFDPFGSEVLREKDYRLRLSAAIDSLSPTQKRIVTMHSKGFTFDSKDPEALTISKALKLSDKTVRTRHQEALAKLKKFLEKGGDQ